jgi:hypothetical protein
MCRPWTLGRHNQKMSNNRYQEFIKKEKEIDERLSKVHSTKPLLPLAPRGKSKGDVGRGSK